MNQNDIKTDDLDKLIEVAILMATSPHRVRCRLGFCFDSTVTEEPAFVFDGVTSPRFIDRELTANQIEAVPLACSLHNVGLIIVDNLADDIEAWIPLLGELVKENKSLLVLTGKVQKQSMVATTLFVNFSRGVVKVGIIVLSEGTASVVRQYGLKITSSQNLKTTTFEQLPFAREAILRHDTTIIPQTEGSYYTVSTAVIDVGGRDADEQRQRLFYVADRISKLSQQSSSVSAVSL